MAYKVHYCMWEVYFPRPMKGLKHKSENNRLHNECVVFIHLHKMPSGHIIEMWPMFPV